MGTRLADPFRISLSVAVEDTQDTLTVPNSTLRESLRAELRAQSFWSPWNLEVYDVHIHDEVLSSTREQSIFDVFLAPSPVSLPKSHSSRRRRPGHGWTVNDINLPLALPTACLQKVFLDVTISSNVLRASLYASSTSQTRHGQLAGPQAQDLSKGWLGASPAVNSLSAQPSDEACQGMKRDGTQELIQRALRCICLPQKFPTPMDSKARAEGFRGNLQSTFPTAFSARHLRTVVERVHLLPSILRSLEAFSARGKKLSEPLVPTERKTARILPRASPSEIDLWSTLLSGNCRAIQGDHVVATGTAQQRGVLQNTAQLNPGQREALLERDANLFDHYLDKHNARDHITSRFRFGQLAEGAYDSHMKDVNLPRDQLTFSTQSSFLNRSDTFHELHFEDTSIRQRSTLADMDAWPQHRDTIGSSSQTSAAHSEEQSGRCVASASKVVGDMWSSIEWDLLIGCSQQLSQTSPRVDPFEQLTVLCGNSAAPNEDISQASQEDMADLSSELEVTNLDIAAAHHSLGEDERHDTAGLYFGTLRQTSPSSSYEDLINQHEVLASSTAETATNIGRVDNPWSPPTTTPIFSPHRTSISSILTMGFVNRRGSSGSDQTQSPHRLNLRPFTKHCSAAPRTSSADPGSLNRPADLVRRFSRRHHDSSENELCIAELETGKVKGREISLKRRKTLEDYEICEEDDDEMLFV